MNRIFEFSTMQLRFVIILAGILLVLSTYKLVKSFSRTEQGNLKFYFQSSDNDTRYSPVFKIDLNHSPADSLELIPGIGPVLAGRIVGFRDSTGGFEKIDDVMMVEGIGYGTFKKIKSYLEVRPW